MRGLLFDDISGYVRDLIFRELIDQTGSVDEQKDGSHINRPPESEPNQDEQSSNTATDSLDQ